MRVEHTDFSCIWALVGPPSLPRAADDILQFHTALSKVGSPCTHRITVQCILFYYFFYFCLGWRALKLVQNDRYIESYCLVANYNMENRMEWKYYGSVETRHCTMEM